MKGLRSNLTYFILLLFLFQSIVVNVKANENDPKDVGNKPISMGIFLFLLAFISICVGIFILIIDKIQKNEKIITIDRLVLIAIITIIANSVIVGYLYVEY